MLYLFLGRDKISKLEEGFKSDIQRLSNDSKECKLFCFFFRYTYGEFKWTIFGEHCIYL